MSKHLSALLAATALAACSSDPRSVVEPAGSAAPIAQDLPTPAPVIDPEPYEHALGPEAPLPPAAPLTAPEPSLDARPQVQSRSLASACDVVAERARGRIVLTAVADLDRPMSGGYSFVITKSGGGSSSDIEQGGPFKSKGAGPVELSSSEISLERGSSYRATLTLTSQGREVCRRTVRS